MNNFILIILLLIPTACSDFKSSKNVEDSDKTPISNEVILVSNNLQNNNLILKSEDSNKFDCSELNGYKVEKDRDNEFNLVNIVQDEKIVETLKLPTGLSQNGFALNWAKRTKSGVEISIEYGSRFYYQKNFIFECVNHQLYLTKINITTFDKHNPEKSWKERKTDVKPKVPLSNFKVTDYITN